MSCHAVVSCLVWCLVLSCLVLSCLVLSCLVLSCDVMCCVVLSCLVLSCLILSCLVLSCLVIGFVLWLSCFTLCCDDLVLYRIDDRVLPFPHRARIWCGVVWCVCGCARGAKMQMEVAELCEADDNREEAIINFQQVES